MKYIRKFNEDLNIDNNSGRTENYMFFNNLNTIKRSVDEMLQMDESKIDSILSEHDWASDHISVANENIEHVFNFLSDPKLESNINESDMSALSSELRRLKEKYPGKKVTYFFTKDSSSGYKFLVDGKSLDKLNKDTNPLNEKDKKIYNVLHIMTTYNLDLSEKEKYNMAEEIVNKLNK